MKKRIVALLLLMGLLTGFMCSCDNSGLFGFLKPPNDEEMIEERINTFVTAYNNGDIEEVKGSLTKKTRNQLDAILNLIGVFAKVDVSTLFSSLFTLGAGMSEGDSIRIEILDISIENGEKAIVETNFAVPGANQEAELTYIILIKEDGDWFISDITSNI